MPTASPPPGRPGTPLRDRPVNDSTAAPPPPRQGARRHCWVAPTNESAEPHPGLVIDWRRGPTGQWQPRVTYVVDEGQDTVVVTQWLDLAFVQPAAPDEPPSTQTRSGA